jgi:hypothetical protein
MHSLPFGVVSKLISLSFNQNQRSILFLFISQKQEEKTGRPGYNVSQMQGGEA